MADVAEVMFRGRYDGGEINRGLDGLKRKLDEVDKSAGGAGGGLRGMGSAGDALAGTFMRLVGGVTVVGALAKAFDVLSGSVSKSIEATETLNLFTVSMGRMKDEANAWADEVSRALHLNATELKSQLGTWKMFFENQGLGAEKAVEMGRAMTMLANDMASFRNAHPEEVFQKLSAGMSGEAEPLKRWGIIVTENAVKAEAYAKGIAKVGEELDTSQKLLARYSLIMQQTKKDQGDLNRTLDSPANLLRAISSEWKTVQERMGEFVTNSPSYIGALQDIVGALSSWSAALRDLRDAQKDLDEFGTPQAGDPARMAANIETIVARLEQRLAAAEAAFGQTPSGLQKAFTSNAYGSDIEAQGWSVSSLARYAGVTSEEVERTRRLAETIQSLRSEIGSLVEKRRDYLDQAKDLNGELEQEQRMADAAREATEKEQAAADAADAKKQRERENARAMREEIERLIKAYDGLAASITLSSGAQLFPSEVESSLLLGGAAAGGGLMGSLALAFGMAAQGQAGSDAEKFGRDLSKRMVEGFRYQTGQPETLDMFTPAWSGIMVDYFSSDDWAQLWAQAGARAGEVLGGGIADALYEVFTGGEVEDALGRMFEGLAANAAESISGSLMGLLFGGVDAQGNPITSSLTGISGGIGGKTYQKWAAEHPTGAGLTTLGMAAGSYLYSAGVQGESRGQAALGGAISGASIGQQAYPGWGAVIGAVVGAIAGYFSAGDNKMSVSLRSYIPEADASRWPSGLLPWLDVGPMQQEEEILAAVKYREKWQSTRRSFNEILASMGAAIPEGTMRTPIVGAPSEVSDFGSWWQAVLSRELPLATFQQYRGAIGQGLTGMGVGEGRVEELLGAFEYRDIAAATESLRAFVEVLVSIGELGSELTRDLDSLREEVNRGAMEQFRAGVEETMDALDTAKRDIGLLSLDEQVERAQQGVELIQQQFDSALQLLGTLEQLRRGIQDQYASMIEGLDQAAAARGGYGVLTGYLETQLGSAMGRVGTAQGPEDLQEAWSDVVRYAQALSQVADAVEALLPSFDALHDALVELGEDLGKSLAERIDDLTQDTFVGFMESAADLLDQLEELGAGLDGLTGEDMLERVGRMHDLGQQALESANRALGEVVRAMDSVDRTFSSLFQTIDEAEAEKQGPEALAKYYIDQLMALQEALSEATTPAEIESITQQMAAFAQKLYGMGDSVLLDAGAGAGSILDWLRPWLEEQQAYAQARLQQFGEQTQGIVDALEAALGGLTDVVLTERERLATEVERLRDLVRDVLADAVTRAGESIDQWEEEVRQVLQALAEALAYFRQILIGGAVPDASGQLPGPGAGIGSFNADPGGPYPPGGGGGTTTPDVPIDAPSFAQSMQEAGAHVLEFGSTITDSTATVRDLVSAAGDAAAGLRDVAMVAAQLKEIAANLGGSVVIRVELADGLAGEVVNGDTALIQLQNVG